VHAPLASRAHGSCTAVVGAMAPGISGTPTSLLVLSAIR